jgi:enoyl-[acyl-carrier protein] reductase I
MGFMAGKKALIVGVASDRSIASGIAEAFAREGAEIAFTYQNDKLKSRVEKLAERLGQNTDLLFPCDVTSDAEIDAVFAELGKHWDGLDVVVHSVGFAPREQLAGGFTESITREGYAISHDISAYSLATKVVPNYNVMGLAKASLEACVRFLAADLGPKGIRVNAISAGAVKTLAAAGIGGFRKMQSYAVKAAPLRRTVTIEEIGNAAAFLCSDLTGETTFVDAGVNIMGMVFDED